MHFFFARAVDERKGDFHLHVAYRCISMFETILYGARALGTGMNINTFPASASVVIQRDRILT